MKREIIITEDGSPSLWVPELQETYHSRFGAMQESRHVYIEAGLKPSLQRHTTLNVLEIGFGTGLNCLLTLEESIHYGKQIFYEALENKDYKCPLKEDTYLPMMYMPDAIRATIELMEAPADKISVRTSYNISAMSFSPKDIAAEIEKHIPEFKIIYQPDYRQAIAESWPQSIDDSVASADWGWKPEYNIERMTKDMLDNLT